MSWKSVLGLSLGALLIQSPSYANENLHCLGVAEALGANAISLADRENGKIRLSKLIKGMPNVSYENLPDTQKLKFISDRKDGASGVLPPGMPDLDFYLQFNYKGGRLQSFSRRAADAGKSTPEAVFTGVNYTYDWPAGNCRPSKITVQNRLRLQNRTGILFDGKICEELEKKIPGFNSKQNQACLETARKVIERLHAIDKQLNVKSGGKELLVTQNPLLPNDVLPLGKQDSGIAIQMMANCAAYRAAEAAQPPAGEAEDVEAIEKLNNAYPVPKSKPVR